MALFTELPVYRDTHKLAILLYQTTNNFSRDYKHDLGLNIKQGCLNLIRCIYHANISNDKVIHLKNFEDHFEILKFEMRLSVDLKLLSIDKYSKIILTMDTIGKQITGWKKSSS